MGANTTEKLSSLNQLKQSLIEAKLYIDNILISVTQALSEHVEDTQNPHGITAEQIGLGNVDNTSDLDKPVSTATQAAISTHAENSTVHITAAQRTAWDSKPQDVTLTTGTNGTTVSITDGSGNTASAVIPKKAKTTYIEATQTIQFTYQ